MVDKTGEPGNGSMQRAAQSAALAVLARFAMILWAAIGGPVAVWVLITGLGLMVDLRDSMRDLKRDVAAQGKVIEEMQREDRRTLMQLDGFNTRLQGLEFQTRPR